MPNIKNNNSTSNNSPPNNQQQQLSASIKNRQRTFNQNLPQLEPEHPLFRSSTTAKIFPALAVVTDKEVAQMFGLPEIDKRKAKESYLIERSDPFREKPSVFSREGMRGGGGLVSASGTNTDGYNNNSNSNAALAAQYYGEGSGSGSGAAGSGSNNNNNNNGSNNNNNSAHRGAHHDLMVRNRLKRPFVVTRHGGTTGGTVQSVFAGCDFEGDEREEKKKEREKLHTALRTNNRGNAFIVRSSADAAREVTRHEYLTSVDDDTMELLKDYIFSGRAALDAAAKKRDEINDKRTNQRRQKGIRQQQQQQKLKLIRDNNNNNSNNNNE